MRKHMVFGLAAWIAVVGCSTMRVETDYAGEVDFAAFKTFQYEDSDESVADTAPLAHDRIVAAIRQAMVASGLTEVDSDPDLRVTYYGSTSEEVQLHTTYMGMDTWSIWSRRGRVGAGSSTTRATTYEQGTLVIDLWQVQENRLVWRGLVADTLSSSPDRNTDRINRGISKVFKTFPPS